MLEIVERRQMRTYTQTLLLLQLVNFLIAVSRIVSGNIMMKIIAFLLMSTKKFLRIETGLSFPAVNVTCSQPLLVFQLVWPFGKWYNFFLNFVKLSQAILGI